MMHISQKSMLDGIQEALAKSTEPAARLAALIALMTLLTRIGVKDSKESMNTLLERLAGKEPPHSLFVESHREIMIGLIRDMFAPAGAKRFVLLGVTDENKVIFCPLADQNEKYIDEDEAVKLFRHIANALEKGDGETITP